MSTFFTLANFTKRERINFIGIAYTPSAKGITGTSAATLLVAQYMLKNRGDLIAFVSSEGGIVMDVQEDDAWLFTDVTAHYAGKTDS